MALLLLLPLGLTLPLRVALGQLLLLPLLLPPARLPVRLPECVGESEGLLLELALPVPAWREAVPLGLPVAWEGVELLEGLRLPVVLAVGLAVLLAVRWAVGAWGGEGEPVPLVLALPECVAQEVGVAVSAGVALGVGLSDRLPVTVGQALGVAVPSCTVMEGLAVSDRVPGDCVGALKVALGVRVPVGVTVSSPVPVSVAREVVGLQEAEEERVRGEALGEPLEEGVRLARAEAEEVSVGWEAEGEGVRVAPELSVWVPVAWEEAEGGRVASAEGLALLLLQLVAVALAAGEGLSVAPALTVAAEAVALALALAAGLTEGVAVEEGGSSGVSTVQQCSARAP